MFHSFVNSFLKEEDGQDLVEYSLLLAFIGLAATAILTTVKKQHQYALDDSQHEADDCQHAGRQVTTTTGAARAFRGSLLHVPYQSTAYFSLMNRRFASVLLFALLVAAATSLLVYHFVVVNVQAASLRPVPKHKVLVAAHTLELGALIQDGDLRWASSVGALPPQAINDTKEAIGRGVIAAIYEGEPISSARLAPKGAGAGLAAIIPVGKRAVALKVDDVVGLAGFVVPGMRVDVIVAGGNMQDSRAGVLSRTVLQNIEVLSAGQKIEKTADGRPQSAQVVNLLVTPDQAEVLSLASNETKVQLVLRNPLDTQEEKTHGTSVAALFGQDVAPPVMRSAPVRIQRPAPPKPLPATVEVYSGTKRTDQTLDTNQ